MDLKLKKDVLELKKNNKQVKASVLQNDPPEKWIVTSIMEILSTDDYSPDGVEIMFSDYRSGYCKESIEEFTNITSTELSQLIVDHETLYFELKSSFQWSIRYDRKAECLGEQVVREIAAFMNGKGGKICIGINDQRTTLGLKKDFSITTVKQGQAIEDAFVSKIRNFVKDRLTVPTTENLFNSYMMKYDQQQVCIIDVKESSIPIFVLEKFVPGQCDADGPPAKQRKWPFYTRLDQGTREHSPYDAKIYWNEQKNSPFL
jgi:predicted HTH transcriptional regulator